MSGTKQIAWAVAASLLVVAFMRAVETPVPGFGSAVISLVSSKANRLPGLGDDQQQPSILNRAPRDVPPAVHASFLLFDFKQNLRRWPVLSGDISRSPPFFLPI